MMSYIVNLTVLLDGIFKAATGNVTEDAVLKVMDAHVKSGRRDSIHRDIRSFVTVRSVGRRPAERPGLRADRVLDQAILCPSLKE